MKSHIQRNLDRTVGDCPSFARSARKNETPPFERAGCSSRSALSLVEVVAATMIVGMMAVAALNSLGEATRSAESTGNRAVAQAMANQLISEILGLPYAEPVEAVQFGLEPAENNGSRALFDDVDDYHNLDEQPPLDRNGTPVVDRDGWRHRVEVSYVRPDKLFQAVGADQGAKRIRVTVEYDGHVLAELIAVKTNHP